MLIRNALEQDLPAVLALNAAVQQWTSPLDGKRLQELAEYACYFKTVWSNGQCAGFLLVMRCGCGYDSENFQWFEARYDDFLYVDRIVIAQQFAGRSFGRALYEDAFTVGRELGIEQVVCEYNWEPLNQGSQHFHQRMGFVEVGQRAVAGSSKVLSMQHRKLMHTA